ncbi:MAG: MgtC/SapB transporter [Candidatus Magasanikbacteria bacterium GW2011_GWA2_56_11]|uniref:MgtC/SapB transporter n=1 Tax=Candidatus Magasanikbacteria bacterium GW2011_GWA2_56_11 TaxID=1619044 RepID=A0A0G2ALE6_9BACT|nr:MAG: MgtC/SapB transporter [Candidatus Magasanikbacteria bacterium GW2011_GWA2_56_11]
MDYATFALQLLLAIILGGLIGWQREKSGKAAGVRTFTLVTLGSMLFTVISVNAFPQDPSRIVAQILTGIGFIGAGTIIHKKDAVEGLTTAAGFWAAAALGIALGVEWFIEAAVAAAVIMLILLLPERKLFR